MSRCNYIEYWNAIDSLYWNVESISKFDYEGASTLMGPSGPHSEIIFLVSTTYEGWIGF